MKRKATLVAVVDGAHARFLLHEGPGRPLTAAPLPEMRQEVPASHELGSDRPGRSHDRFGPGRHAMEPTSDPHEEQERRFAREVAERINGALEQDTWRLVLVAAPRALGTLRPLLSDEARGRLLGELAKDLTKSSDQAVNDALADLLPVA